jgi:hypothetical protein
MSSLKSLAIVVVVPLVGAIACSSRDTTGLAVKGDAESRCLRYAKSRDASLRAEIAARQDAATMTAIENGDLTPGLPAIVAYCVHGAPIRRQRAAAAEGEIEHVTFCAKPIDAGETCAAEGPTITIAADRIAANPQPESNT